MKICIGAVALVLASCAATHARAAPSARLVYVRDPGAESCPDEAAVRSAVAARLGYDPFFPFAPATMFAELSMDGETFRARIKLIDDKNMVRGARELSQQGGQCSGMIDAMAISMSIAIDPLSLARSKSLTSDAKDSEGDIHSSAKAASPPPDIGSEQESTKSARPSEMSRGVSSPDPTAPRVHFDAGISARLWIGAAPAPNFSGSVFARVRWRLLSLAAEGRLDAAASQTLASGPIVQTWLRAGSFVPCVRFSWLGVCLESTFGALLATSLGVTSPAESSAFHAALGPRVELEAPSFGRLSLWGHITALAALTSQTLELNGRDIYSLPPWSAAVGAGVSFHFF